MRLRSTIVCRSHRGDRPFWSLRSLWPLSLTPVEAPQLCCGLLSWCFARVSLRLCLKLHQRPSRPLESRQGRMALNPVAQALPAGVLWHQGFAFKQCLRFRSIVVDRNCKAAEPPSAPAPCRSGVRGRSAPAAGGNLRAYRPAHKPNRRFGRGARTVCCANAQKDRAPEGARIPLSTTLIARILTMFAAPINPCLSELQGGRPFDRSTAFAAFAHTGRSAATSLRSSELVLRPGQLEALPQTPPKAFAAFGIPPGPNGPEPGRFASPYGWRRSAFSALMSRLVLR